MTSASSEATAVELGNGTAAALLWGTTGVAHVKGKGTTDLVFDVASPGAMAWQIAGAAWFTLEHDGTGGVLTGATNSAVDLTNSYYFNLPVVAGIASHSPGSVYFDTTNNLFRGGANSAVTKEFATASGTRTTNKQLAFDANGNVIASATDIGGTGSTTPELTRRTCMLQLGDGTNAILTADLSPFKQGRCYVPYAATLVEVTLQGDTGTASVLLQRRRDASTVADLLAAALASAGTTETCAGATCFNGTTPTGTLSNTALLAGDWIEVKSGTGNTTTALSVAVVFTVN